MTDLWTVAQAAAALNVKERWIRERIARREIDFVKLRPGRLIRLRRSDIEAIAANVVEAEQ